MTIDFPAPLEHGWRPWLEGLLTNLDERGEPHAPGERLCIFYGIPQNVNELFDPEQAAALFSRWDLVVFGQPIQDPEGVDYPGAVQTITRIKQMNPRARVFGYVSLGVTTANLTDQQIRDQIDAFHTMGVTGMLLDEYGFDYHVSRIRQNAAVDYCHQLGLAVLVNAWIQVEAFAATLAEAVAVDSFVDQVRFAQYNPGNTPPTIAAGDYTLLETWIVNTEFADYDPNGVAGIFNIRHRARHARYFRNTLGVKWLGASVINYGDPAITPEQEQAFFDLTEAFALVCGADGWGVDAFNYSSSLPAGNLGVVRAWNFDRRPYTRLPDYHVSLDSLTLTRQDLRLRLSGTNVNPGQSVWTITDLGV